jgi:hypothetical protein
MSNSESDEKKCLNYQLCRDTVPNGMGEDFCMTCGSWFKVSGFGWDKLHFITNNDPCNVCFENCNEKLMFPTNCGHSFCIDCSRKILFWDETRYHLSPVPFGCPPCPNGCVNPIKGTQCYCIEYDDVQELWKQKHPKQFKLWNDKTHISIDTNDEQENISDTCDVKYGSKICPTCRQKYVRTNFGKYKTLGRWSSDDIPNE